MPQNDGTIQIDGATLMFRNFRGLESEYNPAGSRHFSVQIDPELAAMLRRDGWNVKQLRVREEGDIPQDFLQVRVKYHGRNGKEVRPPTVFLITSGGKTPLDESTIGLLDHVEIANVDLIIRPYEWSMRGDHGVTAYLKTMFLTASEDALQQRYRDVPEIGGGALAELEAGDDVQEADWDEIEGEEQKAIGTGV